MATILDIAKLAGVSHGTVSNVLNGKGNVSVKKIQLVEEAAKRLGYKINYTAKSLRSGATKSVSIILPSVESEEYSQMYEGLDKTLTELGYRTHLYTTYDLQHNEKSILKEIAEVRVTGVVTISCLDDANDYYEELDIPKENIIFVNRKLNHAAKFVSFDFTQAGKEISEFLSKKDYKAIGIFSDQIKFSNEKQFIDSITNGLNQKTLRYVHSTFNQAYSKAFEFFTGEPLDLIITSSLSKANILKNANYWGSVEDIPQILSLTPTQSAFDHKMIKYQQNYFLLGSKVAELLIKSVNDNQTMDPVIMFNNHGISKFTEVEKESRNSNLKLLTIPSPTTDAINKLLPHFEKRTGIKVELSIQSYDEIYQILSNPIEYNYFDMIRMDMAWLAWFGKDVYQPLNKLDQNLDQIIVNYPSHIKHNYSEIEGISYAIPFDPSVQMLFYRKDLFESQKVKRMYFEKYKKQLTLPDDYESYIQLLEFFSRDYDGNSPTKYGTSAILARSEIIAAEFLTRYYADKGTLINKEGKMKLDSKKAIKSLKNYLKTVSLSQKLDANWWGEAVNSFACGETAMILGFMNHVSRIAHSDIGALIGFAPVPGKKPLLGGGVVGITHHSKKRKEAISFLNWVNETEIAEQITLLGGTSANQNLGDNQMIRMLYPWLEGAIHSNVDGIRDTKTKDGRRLNTRKIEQIIGESIKEILKDEEKIEIGVEKMNKRLAESKEILIQG